MRHVLLSLAVLLVTCGSAANATPTLLRIYTENLPPFNTIETDGHIGGSATKKVAALLKASNTPYSIELTSWARAIEIARTQTNSCVYSAARTPEREDSFHWIGIVGQNDGVLFALASKSGLPSTIEGAMGARIGGYHSSASAMYLVQRGYNVIMSGNHEISLKNLLAGRLDYWLANRASGAAVIAKMGVNGKVVPVIPVINLDMYLACNRELDASLVKQLQTDYLRLQRKGVFRAIDSITGTN